MPDIQNLLYVTLNGNLEEGTVLEDIVLPDGTFGPATLTGKPKILRFKGNSRTPSRLEVRVPIKTPTEVINYPVVLTNKQLRDDRYLSRLIKEYQKKFPELCENIPCDQ
jgi:hypothetical protein